MTRRWTRCASSETRRAREYVPPYEMAATYVALGDHARALELLQRAVADTSHSIALLAVDPRLAPLARDPAFQALRRHIRERD